MRNYLYGTPAEIPMTFFLKNRPVNLTGCHIGIFVKAFINESLIVSQIQICLCTVICYKDFSVLNRVHSSRININIRIKLLHGHLVTSRFQKTSQRRCCDTFSKTGNNSSCDKYVFNCHFDFLLHHPLFINKKASDAAIRGHLTHLVFCI